ncbi:MAG TPA: SDR family NAD(P)-dependent oxidoreductase, partial [Beutenbergiaceae bacterium]|nr:SDR family NAD(P)-dependent oxidoreductase [Beutenbergiaceae bacterium]
MSTDAPIAVITGANKGLGYFTGEGLARKGYRIILVGRRHDRLVAAQETLRTRVPGVRTGIAIADFSGLTTARSGA